MIFYLTTRYHAYTILQYLEVRVAAAPRILPLSYELLAHTPRVQPGTYIFADLERLTPPQTEMAARVWTALAAAGSDVRLLNDPMRSLGRFELLRTLYESGVNSFNVYRAREGARPERYPVFVRSAWDHTGNLTPLLDTPEALAGALGEMERSGGSLDDKLIVEFADTSGGSGVYRKYAAFVVGDRVIARHLFFERVWTVKGPRLKDEDLLAEERAYVETNPHEASLREIFRRARIDFGRIDYGLADGRPIVWEINTNPVILGAWASQQPGRAPVHRRFAGEFEWALQAIDCQPRRRQSIRVSHPISRGGKLLRPLRRWHLALPERHRRFIDAIVPEAAVRLLLRHSR